MNILIIHNYYKLTGGEDFVFENEVKVLKEKGHKVITYTRHNDETDKYNIFQKILFFFNSFKNQKTVKDIKKIIKNNNIDIAHIHNIFPLISPYIYKILKKYKIKIVQTIHNYRFLCPNGLMFRDSIKCTECIEKNVFRCVLHKCYKNSRILSILYSLLIFFNNKNFRKNIDKYIVLTEFVQNIFIKEGYDRKKFAVKDNGFIDDNFRRKKTKGYFLYLGRLSKEKGIKFLLDFFAKNQNFKLVVAGTGDNFNELKNKYDMPNIVFKGFVQKDEKRILIQNSQCLLVPSVWYENYPMSVVEAFKFGIPVIGSNIGGLPYIIKDNYNGYVFDINDEAEFSKKIKLVLHNNIRNKLGDNARKTFENKMEFDKNINVLINLYKDIINE